ncbi:MAG: anaerobic sulfatase maturase [Anaerolineales bacterium]
MTELQPARLNAFHIMVKPRGAICNLNCSYCYFLKKEALYPSSDFRMTEEVLEKFTRQYIQAQRVPQVTFAWQGGEPTLMGLDFYRKAVELQNKYALPGMKVENTLQTNATLLDDEWCQFFREAQFLVGVSLDGPKERHDIYRQNKGGAGSYDSVIQGLDLLKKHKVDFNILTTVNAVNAAYPLEIYRHFRDELEVDYIQFIPIVERINKRGEQRGNKVSNRSVTGEQYGDFLIEVFDEWLARDVGKVFVQIFEVAFAKWLGQPGGLCVFDPICGRALAIEHNGDLFSCDHYVEQRYRLGNIHKSSMVQLVGSAKQQQFGMEKRTSLPQYCLDCEVLFACNGGCPKNRIRHTPAGEYGLNYLCQGYRKFFNYINQPMRDMAARFPR